jgi:exopolysaccharide biosynthesis polyprenyl glycosylphosphotransferase
MADAPIVYQRPPGEGTTASLASAHRKKRETTGAPVLVGAIETGTGSLSAKRITHATHPFARAKGPLATPQILGGPWVQLAYVMTDMLLVLFDFILVAKLRWFGGRGGGSPFDVMFSLFGSGVPPHYLSFLVLYAPLVALFCHTQALYHTARDRSRLDETLAVAKAVCFATVLLTASIYASGVHTISRLVVWGSAVLNIVTLSTWRLWKRGMVERRVAAGVGVKNVLIIGAGKAGREVASYLDQNKQLGWVVRGFIDQNHATNPRVLGRIEDLSTIARAQFVDEIIITISSMQRLVKQVILEAKRNNLDIKLIPRMYGAYGGRATLEHMGGIPVMSLYGEPVPLLARLAKRLFDVIGALFGLVALSPLLMAIAVLIKCDSTGPVFYRSRRVGKKGKLFVCYKFRTMVTNADSLKDSLRYLNEREGVIFKITNDPRITRVGRLLRKYSLDEFPQLWNVLTGDMSLVGPRPHPVDDYKRYELKHLRRLDVTPGLTGLWQVTARRNPSFEKSVALDLEYIENWSLGMDFSILLGTFSAVLSGDGA